MKKAVLFTMALILSACATPEMTPEQQKVRPMSNTNNCKFIKTAYFEVSHPSKVHYYAAKNTALAGGDAYQIMASGNDVALGLKINTTTIGIYKCN